MDGNVDNLSDNARGLLNRARAYCAGSEQCRQTVRRKLYDWGADGAETERVLCRLEEEGYLDERRYVHAYCESKLLRARWGERKVRYELMHKGIPQALIDECVGGMDGEARSEALRMAAEKKMATLGGLDEATARRRLLAWLAQRGFTMEEINTFIS